MKLGGVTFELSEGDLLASYLKLHTFATKQMASYMVDAYSEHLAHFDDCVSILGCLRFSS